MKEPQRTIAGIVDLALEATVVLSFSRVGYQVRRRVFAWPHQLPPMSGKVALITGATSGLGQSVAATLAGLGATVVVSGRDPRRTAQSRADLIEATGNPRIHDLVADLAHLDQVVALADRVLDDHDRLDVVVHSAGALVHDFERTDDGLEITVQTHVVAPHLLTRRLFERLATTPSSRVVWVASGGMYTRRLASLDVGPDGFDGVHTYALAKRAQVVLAHQWADRARGSGVTFHAMHPGWVDTPGLARSLPGFHRRLGPWLRTPDQGADTIAWLAADPAGAEPDHEGGGRFWLDRHPRRVDKLPWTTTPPDAADQLWNWATTQADRVAPASTGRTR